MVASDSPGLVNFAIRVVDPVLNLPGSPRASSRGALWRRGKQISFPLPSPTPVPLGAPGELARRLLARGASEL